MDRRIEIYKRYHQGFGEILVQMNVEDTRLGVAEYLRKKHDLETIEAALTIAETGHLTFATLHTNSAAQTMNRIIDVFPPHQQQQIRVQLSTTLKAVICQQLLPRLGGKGGSLQER
jgi:hypothetical protein